MILGIDIMPSLATRKNVRKDSLSILQRVVQRDKTAVEDCIDNYGSLVWAVAKKFTDSSEEAEKAVLTIFNDIWRCAARYDSAKCTEEKYVLRLAIRHLIEKNLLENRYTKH